MKFTKYFEAMCSRSDLRMIKMAWIARVVTEPEKQVVQTDGRNRRRAPIAEMDGRFLRVVLLEDRETVHNAFFDRSLES